MTTFYQAYTEHSSQGNTIYDDVPNNGNDKISTKWVLQLIPVFNQKSMSNHGIYSCPFFLLHICLITNTKSNATRSCMTGI